MRLEIHTATNIKITVFWDVAFYSLAEFTDISEVLAVSIVIILITEATRTFETSVNFYQTTGRNIPEDCNLNTRRLENLKSYNVCVC
jgi:hypothetical protein